MHIKKLHTQQSIYYFEGGVKSRLHRSAIVNVIIHQHNYEDKIKINESTKL